MRKSALPDSGTAFGERVRRRLREEQVIWITTVGKDGTPQPNPVGFLLQEDDSFLIYNAAEANRLAHVLDRPRVALHFDGDGTGGDIVIFTGTARRAADVPPPHENAAWLAKYADGILRMFGSARGSASDSRCRCGSRSREREACSRPRIPPRAPN
jgi:PPOX class probable F420-dependent enzyme